MPEREPISLDQHRKEGPPHHEFRKSYHLANAGYHPGEGRDQYVEHSNRYEGDCSVRVADVHIASEPGVCFLGRPFARGLNTLQIKRIFWNVPRSKVGKCYPDR